MRWLPWMTSWQLTFVDLTDTTILPSLSEDAKIAKESNIFVGNDGTQGRPYGQGPDLYLQTECSSIISDALAPRPDPCCGSATINKWVATNCANGFIDVYAEANDYPLPLNFTTQNGSRLSNTRIMGI